MYFDMFPQYITVFYICGPYSFSIPDKSPLVTISGFRLSEKAEQDYLRDSEHCVVPADNIDTVPGVIKFIALQYVTIQS